MTDKNPDSTELLGLFRPPEGDTKKLPGKVATESVGSMTLVVTNQPKSGEQTSLLRDRSALVRKAGAILNLRVLEYLGVDWQTAAKCDKTTLWGLGPSEDQWHALPYPVDQASGPSTARQEADQ